MAFWSVVRGKHGRKRIWILWGCGGLIVAILALVVYAELTEDQKAVRETIRAIFAGETQADRDAAFDQLVALGAQDLGLVYWGLEAHNATFMFAPAKLNELFDRIAAAHGGAATMIAVSRVLLAGDDWVGKRCALLALDRLGAVAGGEVETLLADTTVPTFLRCQAALTLGRIGTAAAAPGLSLVLRDSLEPGRLREACAEGLAMLDPGRLEQDASSLIGAAGTPPGLVRRLVDRLTDRGLATALRASLTDVTLGADRRNQVARGLLRMGDPQDLSTIQQLATDGTGPPGLTEVLLDQLARQDLTNFDDFIRTSLGSPSKKVRMLAILAAGTAGLDNALIQGELAASGQTLTAEELQVLARVSN